MDHRPILVVVIVFSLLLSTIQADRKSYIVYLGKHSHEVEDAALYRELVTDAHQEFLGSFVGSKDNAKDSILYSYTSHINAFAANLNENEVAQLLEHPDVVSVFPNKAYTLHTTRTWEFMGQESAGKVLPTSLWKKADFGEDVIIANIDSGVWPGAESFDDRGYGPIPKRWKGFCDNNQTHAKHFHCNRKLIGARLFDQGYVHLFGPYKHRSPFWDSEGHGTHTLSTAGGNVVQNASLYGLANGTIKGGAPRARVAAYKVCGPRTFFMSNCIASDILAGFDAAIADGVDVLSISMGGASDDYLQDPIAIGTFHAISRGIHVIVSAGNSGPATGTVVNVAPWQLSVAASTVDREFPALLFLGNNKTIKGQSMSLASLPPQMYPLVMAVDIKTPYSTPESAAACEPQTLDPAKAKGKIIVCIRTNSEMYEGMEIKYDAGGAGLILINNKTTGSIVIPLIHVVPATHLPEIESDELLTYMTSTKSPVGYIGKPSTSVFSKPSPSMAFFSSKGPNPLTPQILKPDITAPGVSILAAYSMVADPLAADNSTPKYNFMSGTSMSCPHIAGIVALLKKLHPDWSPAAVKSAIMTTAFQKDNTGQKMKNGSLVDLATPFDYGAGHVQPNQANDPGLVYDMGTNDYLNFFCALGYNTSSISKVFGLSQNCSSRVPKISDLNYPSITVVDVRDSTVVWRTLKNVGTPGKYLVDIETPVGVSVTVKPRKLRFKRVGEEKKFTVTFTPLNGTTNEYKFGWMTWSDGKHHVKSPLVVKPL